MKLLIAEDQFQLLEILKERFTKAGYVVDAVSNGETAIDFLDHTAYDVAILDVMMPRKDGYDVLHWMRQRKIDTPVLFLTAKDQVVDRVKGLKLGADDYLIKPFAFEELMARIDALLRRRQKTVSNTIQVADLILDRSAKTVERSGQAIVLTKKEFNVLEALMLHAGETMSRDRLEMVSSSLEYEGYSNIVDVYIRFLRKKIDEPFSKKLIQTVRGFGYMIRGDQ